MKPTVIQDGGSADHAEVGSLLAAEPGLGKPEIENEPKRLRDPARRGTKAMLAIAKATETFAEIGWSFYDSQDVGGVLRAVESSRDHLSNLADGLRARQALLAQQGL